MSRILIIDDDQQLGLSFAKILSQEGYQPANAFSGREGIDKVKTFGPELVILDIRLPDIGGLEVFAVIHELFPKLPVIIITAFGTTDTAIGAIQQGAYDYIYKPFDVPEMLVLIEKALIAGRCMSSPVEVNPDGASGRRARGPGRRQQPDARGVQGHRQGVRNRCDGADQGGVGDRQGAGGAGHLQSFAPGRPALCRYQLRGHPRDPAGKRAVRL